MKNLISINIDEQYDINKLKRYLRLVVYLGETTDKKNDGTEEVLTFDKPHTLQVMIESNCSATQLGNAFLSLYEKLNKI